jgi:hypothetical protein
MEAARSFKHWYLHLHVMPRLKNVWSYTSTPQYVLMVWYLVKHRDNFTFYLYPFKPGVMMVSYDSHKIYNMGSDDNLNKYCITCHVISCYILHNVKHDE